jgi:hypothetical protein
VLDCPDFPIAGETRSGDADPATIPEDEGIADRTESSQMISGSSDQSTNRRNFVCRSTN